MRMSQLFINFLIFRSHYVRPHTLQPSKQYNSFIFHSTLIVVIAINDLTPLTSFFLLSSWFYFLVHTFFISYVRAFCLSYTNEWKQFRVMTIKTPVYFTDFFPSPLSQFLCSFIIVHNHCHTYLPSSSFLFMSGTHACMNEFFKFNKFNDDNDDDDKRKSWCWKNMKMKFISRRWFSDKNRNWFSLSYILIGNWNVIAAETKTRDKLDICWRYEERHNLKCIELLLAALRLQRLKSF
jgi:hypothetical protein